MSLLLDPPEAAVREVTPRCTPADRGVAASRTPLRQTKRCGGRGAEMLARPAGFQPPASGARVQAVVPIALDPTPAQDESRQCRSPSPRDERSASGSESREPGLRRRAVPEHAYARLCRRLLEVDGRANSGCTRF